MASVRNKRAPFPAPSHAGSASETTEVVQCLIRNNISKNSNGSRDNSYQKIKSTPKSVMPPPQKGKAPTKGAKQILMENAATITFYRSMALGSVLCYGIIMGVFYPEDITMWIIVVNVLAAGLQIGCYQLFQYTSRPTYTDNMQLVDPGLDLNMEGGMGEHIKDVVILVSMTHVLAVVSSYFWLLLLLLPLRVFWLLWTNVLGPWFFQQAPKDDEQEDKKRKKTERKMKRYQQ